MESTAYKRVIPWRTSWNEYRLLCWNNIVWEIKISDTVEATALNKVIPCWLFFVKYIFKDTMKLNLRYCYHNCFWFCDIQHYIQKHINWVFIVKNLKEYTKNFLTTRLKKTCPRSTTMSNTALPSIKLELANNYNGSIFSSHSWSNKSIVAQDKITKNPKKIFFHIPVKNS